MRRNCEKHTSGGLMLRHGHCNTAEFSTLAFGTLPETSIKITNKSSISTRNEMQLLSNEILNIDSNRPNNKHQGAPSTAQGCSATSCGCRQALASSGPNSWTHPSQQPEQQSNKPVGTNVGCQETRANAVVSVGKSWRWRIWDTNCSLRRVVGRVVLASAWKILL